MKRNALVAQSGGPSPAINASLQGVVEACWDHPASVGRVLAGWHGVEGILQEQLIDMSCQKREEIELLRLTPAAGAIGTCRYKLTDEHAEDFERIIQVLRAHDIGHFFYIGGNDSMEVARRIAALADESDLGTVVTGVPKTIDNDLGDEQFRLIDHTPGYGSAARYWAYIVQNVNEENKGMGPSECVSVLQAMGRKAGYIPAAARLADPQREMPLQIYLAESRHTLESMAENVSHELRERGRCIVVVSEGFDVGTLGEWRDGFGNIEYGASRTSVAQVVTNYLNEVGFPVRGYATGQVPGVLQRATSAFASMVDLDEAYDVGRKAVEIAVREGSGWMATILRRPGPRYASYYDKVLLAEVADKTRTLPASWLTEDELDVTDDFVCYARPLIGEEWPPIRIEDGLQRFARLEPVFVERKLGPYVPVRHR